MWNKQKLTAANTKSAALPERGIPSAESVRCSFLHNSNTEGNQPAPHVTYRTSGCAKLLAHPRQWEPSELRYAVHYDLVVRVTDMNYTTLARVLHKLLTIMFLRLSQTSIRRTWLSIHSWDPIAEEQSTLYVRIKRITATGIQGTHDTPDTRVLSKCDLRYPWTVSWRRKVKEQHIALRSQRSKEDHIDQSHTSVLTQPMILASQLPIPVIPWSGWGHQRELCISDSLRQATCSNGLECTAMLNSVNGQFVSGVSVWHVGSIFRSQDVRNSSWSILPPKDANHTVPKRR